MLPKAKQEQERQRSIAMVIEMLDRAISQDERRAETLGDLLKDARRELADLLEDEPNQELSASGKLLVERGKRPRAFIRGFREEGGRAGGS